MTLIESRLFRRTGTPALTLAEQHFLDELSRRDGQLEIGLRDLNQAINHDDVAAGIRAARRIASVGALMADAARVLERG